MFKAGVALFMGAWIEISIKTKNVEVQFRRTLHGCVD